MLHTLRSRAAIDTETRRLAGRFERVVPGNTAAPAGGSHGSH